MALSLQRYSDNSQSNINRLLKERIKMEQEGLAKATVELNNGEVLPEHLMIEILSWLPVKDLLQFKSLCKSWYDVINSPNFVTKHLKNYYDNNNCDTRCLLAQYYVTHAELQLFQLLVDEPPRVSAYEVLYRVPMYASYVYGPCNGIYYLYYYDFGRRALWNPAIHELRVLPPIVTKPDLPSDLTYGKHDFYGFGFDPVTDDYKVVVIKGYWAKTDDYVEVTHPLSALVYSFNTDSWRYWGDLACDYWLENNKSYICVNGCFYWLGWRTRSIETSDLIIAYDMVADAFEEIQVPDYDRPASNSLGVYQDSIGFYTIRDCDKLFDIWTLNEGLWTKKLTIEPLLEIRDPLGHWYNNKAVLECNDGTLALCDLDTQEMWDLGFKRYTRCQGVFAYMESLVSIKDRNKGTQFETEEAERYTEQAVTYIEEPEEAEAYIGLQLLFDEQPEEDDAYFEFGYLFD